MNCTTSANQLKWWPNMELNRIAWAVKACGNCGFHTVPTVLIVEDLAEWSQCHPHTACKMGSHSLQRGVTQRATWGLTSICRGPHLPNVTFKLPACIVSDSRSSLYVSANVKHKTECKTSQLCNAVMVAPHLHFSKSSWPFSPEGSDDH